MTPSYDMLRPLWAIPGVAIVALVVWGAVRGKSDFRIVVSGEKVRFGGRFPQGLRADASRFLRDELAPRGKLVISGNWVANHVLRVTIRGPLNEGEKQRVRNYLKMVLRG